MKDGVYIVRGGKTYRVTNDCKCTKQSCSLYDEWRCECDGDKQPCTRLYRIADKNDVSVGSCNFKEVRSAAAD